MRNVPMTITLLVVLAFVPANAVMTKKISREYGICKAVFALQFALQEGLPTNTAVADLHRLLDILVGEQNIEPKPAPRSMLKQISSSEDPLAHPPNPIRILQPSQPPKGIEIASQAYGIQMDLIAQDPNTLVFGYSIRGREQIADYQKRFQTTRLQTEKAIAEYVRSEHRLLRTPNLVLAGSLIMSYALPWAARQVGRETTMDSVVSSLLHGSGFVAGLVWTALIVGKVIGAAGEWAVYMDSFARKYPQHESFIANSLANPQPREVSYLSFNAEMTYRAVSDLRKGVDDLKVQRESASYYGSAYIGDMIRGDVRRARQRDGLVGVAANNLKEAQTISDDRLVTIDQMYYVDPENNEPVLINFMRVYQPEKIPGDEKPKEVEQPQAEETFLPGMVGAPAR